MPHKYLAIMLSVILPFSAFAADKNIIDNPGSIFTVKSGKRTVSCLLVGGSYLSGKLTKDSKFKLAEFEVAAINKKIKKLKKQRQLSLIKVQKKKLKTLKKRISTDNKLCIAGAPPVGTPVPSSDAFSMTKLDRALTGDDVRQLVTRAGFGYSAREEWLVPVAASGGVDALVDQFMTAREEDAGLRARLEDMTDGQIGTSTTQTPPGQREALFELWTHTNNPYSERMALFLLSVWTVGGDVIGDETFRFVFWDYYKKLQTYAAAQTDLPTIGVEITRDPLMLIYLSNELNDKSSPNENYARELMELFTLGPEDLDGQPNYTETREDGSGDIAVAARMLTGWKVDDDYAIPALVPRYLPSRHSVGPHTMFVGKSYQFSGETDEDLVRGIFANHPGVKHYYAKEILKEYLTPTPSRELIEAFARIIAENGYKLRPSMAVLLKSKAFYHPSYLHTLTKNSVEFAVEAVKVLGLQDAYDPNTVDDQIESMGMPVNQTPSVFWFNPNGWTSAAISLERSNFIGRILGDSTAQQKPDPDWSAQLALPSGNVTSSEVIDYVASRLGIVSLPESLKQSLDAYMNRALQYDNSYLSQPYSNLDSTRQKQKGLGLYYILMTTPDFQLK